MVTESTRWADRTPTPTPTRHIAHTHDSAQHTAHDEHGTAHSADAQRRACWCTVLPWIAQVQLRTHPGVSVAAVSEGGVVVTDKGLVRSLWDSDGQRCDDDRRHEQLQEVSGAWLFWF